MHACQESLLHTRDPGQRNFALLVGGIGRLDYPSFSSISLVLEVHKTQLTTSSHRHHCHVDDNWWHCSHRSIYFCHICAAGTGVGVDETTQFAAATGATISLHDLSVQSLCADYDPLMDMRTYVYSC